MSGPVPSSSRPDPQSDTSATPNFQFGTPNNFSEIKPFSFTAPTSILSPEPAPELRRSPRFSGIVTPSSSKPQPLSLFNAVHYADESRPSTPDNHIQDEPSTLLASRIMRAQDNPSPPPPPSRSPIPSSPFNYPDLPFPFSDNDSPVKKAEHISPFPSLPIDSPRPSTPSTPTPSHFHSAPSPACVPLPPSPPAVPTFGIPAQALNESNQLSTSILDASVHEGAINQLSISDRLEEADVASQLITQLDEPADSGEEHNNVESPVTIPIDESPAETEGEFTAPRSSRPRRSTAAYAVPSEDIDTSSVNPAGPSSNAPGKPERVSGFSDPIPPPMMREKSPSRKRPVVSKRQLGSLSPGSVTLLNHLLPTTLTPLEENPAAEENIVSLSSGQPPRPAFGAPPIRFSSPRRPNSPQKIRLRPNDLDDPNRTPARRVPISSNKVPENFFATGSSKSTSIFKIAPTDSPARRVPITGTDAMEGTPSKARLLGSPVRPLFQRSRSAEPQPVVRSQLVPKKRSDSVEPVGVKGKEPTRSVRLLPAEKLMSQNSVSTMIPEEIEPQEIAASENLPASPLKGSSRLKQTTSRIPRMKPYSRPLSTPSQKAEKPSGIARRADRNQAIGSAGSKMEKIQPVSVGRLNIDPGSSAKPRFTPSTASPNLKRKRGPEATPTTFFSPTKGFPSPTKLSPMVVVPTLKSALSKAQIPSQSTECAPEIEQQPQQLPMESDSSHTPILPPSFVGTLAAAVETPVESSSTLDSPEAEAQSDESIASTLPSESALRRTTRTRKPVQATNSQPQPIQRPERPPSRRSRPMVQDTGPFSNMSAIALRALTNSNTTKNQRYIAATLEMEIIRKEGPRPASPVMKVRTIVEKEKEEKQRNRNARAERRARRDQGSSEDIAMTASDSPKSELDENEWDQRDTSPTPTRHSRGAGEEEDYETPDKSLRPAKRIRLLDDDIGDEENVPEKKHVKWDRGLFQEMCLDDIKPRRQHVRSKAPDISKGCLAPTAKALRLDTLGNLPNAESPLKNLVQENVVVKKFVYDTDVEEVPSAPVESTRSTRSKSRKSKS
ncbi:hypothetical protein D9758_003300 [Tetrapyrgos nigripes]|uniref:Uncharacterized protein n=1 Tax=Tetrapyrgos nigripes TaxID=182062 RepID=A0A8H5GIX5_9AGAR|nr:hypothetical protein D9758_003300 [Tetrapyrgos nigripes]